MEKDIFDNNNVTTDPHDESVEEFDVANLLNFITTDQKQPQKHPRASIEFSEDPILSDLKKLAVEVCPASGHLFDIDFEFDAHEDSYTFESMFGITANDPFITDVDIESLPGPDHTKPSVVTRQVQAFYEGQKKMRVPTLPVEPSCYQLKAPDRINYEKTNDEYWQSVLSQLGLDSEDHLKFIMKPDFLDVLPTMLNKYKHGLMPTIDSTWTIAPRLNPVRVFEQLKASPNYSDLLPDYKYDRDNGILIFSHPKYKKEIRYKTNNFSDLENNAFRRILVLTNRMNNGQFDVMVKSLKQYGTTMVQSRNLPRYLGVNDRFLTYSDQLNVYLRKLYDQDFSSIGQRLFKMILQAKNFRYSYEERNKENLYYCDSVRSSSYRYEFFPPFDAKRIAIFSPDKRLTHASLTALISAGNYDIHFYSDIGLAEHGSLPTMYRRKIKVHAVNTFYLLNKKDLDYYDYIYVDFVEVKVLGKMLFGSYCQANIVVRSIQQKGYNGKIIARLGISPEYPVYPGYCVSAISVFKAGGLEYIARIVPAYAEEWNKFMYLKLYAIKEYVEFTRRVTLLAGYGVSCHDYLRPVKSDIKWTVPESAFNLSNALIKPFAYQHTRQTNKFTVRCEDHLDNWVQLSRENQNPEDRIYASAIIHSGFDLNAALGLLDSMNVAASPRKLRTVMGQMVKMNELPKDLLGAIRVSIMLPKKKSYLLKRCPRLEDYQSLFEILDDSDDPDMRFVGCCELIEGIRTVYDINDMRKK